jgi:hypothetical protein
VALGGELVGVAGTAVGATVGGGLVGAAGSAVGGDATAVSGSVGVGVGAQAATTAAAKMSPIIRS